MLRVCVLGHWGCQEPVDFFFFFEGVSVSFLVMLGGVSSGFRLSQGTAVFGGVGGEGHLAAPRVCVYSEQRWI